MPRQQREDDLMGNGVGATHLAAKPLTLPPLPPIPAIDGFRPSVPPQSSRVPAEDIDKLTSSKLPPIPCKLSPSPSQSVPLPPSSPCSPLTQSPTGMNNSQAKTARKSAHVSANRGDGHTSSGNVSRRTSVHQGPKSLMDGNGSASPGENNSASSTSESGNLARSAGSNARVIIPTTQSSQCSPSKQLHQNVSPSGRQGMLSQHARSPSRSPPIPVCEDSVESISKAGRRKTATPKAVAIALEPRMNVDGTTKKNSRKHQTDKPEERKAKRKRKDQIQGTLTFALPVSNQRGNSNARPKPSHPSAKSTPAPGQPAESNASFSAPLISTGAQPGGPYMGQVSRPPGTPKRLVHAIPVPSSPSPVSPGTSTSHVANASGGGEVIIVSSGSSCGTGGLGSDLGSSVERSIRGSESAGCSPSSRSDEGAKGTDNKSGAQGGAAGAPTNPVVVGRFERLERALEETLHIADKFYGENPNLGAHYSRQRFDDFLKKRDGVQGQARLDFLKENLRKFTSDGRVLEWEEGFPDLKPHDYQFALTHHLEVWQLVPPTITVEKRPEEGPPERSKEKSPQEDLGVRIGGSQQVAEENALGKSPRDEPSPNETPIQRADLSQRVEAPPHSAAVPPSFFPAGPSRHLPPENPTHTSTEVPQPASSLPQDAPKDPIKPVSRLELRDSCTGGQSSSTASTTPPTSHLVLHPTRIGRKKLTRPSPPEFAGESQSVVEARSRVLSSGSRQSKNPVLQRISHLRAREHSIWRELSNMAKKVKEKDIEFEKMIENAKVPIDDEMDPDLDSGLEADSVVPIEKERQKVSPDWEALWSIHTDQRSFQERMKQQEMQLVREGSIINVEIKELQKRTSEQAAMVDQMAHRSSQCTESVLGDDDLTLPTKSSSATGSFNELRDATAFGGHRSIFGIPMGDSLVEGLKIWSSDALAPVAADNTAADASEAARAKKKTRRRKMGW